MRHGESEYNIREIINSNKNLEVHLTKKGIIQVKKAALKLKNRKIEIIFSSEFLRCVETAKIMNKYHRVIIKKDRRLNEWKTGFEGRTYKEFNNFLKKNPIKRKLKNSESFLDVKKRLFSFLEFIKKQKYRKVLVVTHEVFLRLIYGLSKNFPDDKIVMKPIENARIIKLNI